MRILTSLLATALLALPLPTLAEGDAEKGEKVFRKCRACHDVGPDAKDKSGPALNGIVGSAAGASPEFGYSTAMKEAAEAGLVWDEASLTAFLTKPRDFLKGTQMSFPGLRKEADVANVIAYLAQQEAAPGN
ncbi:c-type cytochrome [Pseudosulfitobacter pseudonitzschiae]|uniref:c-type cytochrome n=1 Tax=Pseudosulfitobacter pseudonitzschiae TaxID=1402135 RepID=UPI001AF086EA|nr:cytochrome c family protein [Pseudosulfitobacter pseudonitzschiae]MBM1817302.1 cytochrome c family protein [Pseudosulfitobacter pseudonitzschiae]MBM1834313.1 cytochrome c family protein [Pseudosulfitobacter pseudonitzschiae]MBM1839178.1 cytochrome c family protein [Pseudosulfitobacter pseudonitzschiae]MBM1844027.1 cytochrome c family protein [Pseudosulfitobacter pseudonitzschiae]MBM1848863.1 cytochrome c family protein [Pseudosulfitobacter pseudonitzschiae]